MPTVDFSTIVQSLDSLSPGERESLSSILAGKLQSPLPFGRAAAPTKPMSIQQISMKAADWDELAADADVQRELRDIEAEFSATQLDGLDGE